MTRMIRKFQHVALLAMAMLPALESIAQDKKYNVLFVAVDDMNDWIEAVWWVSGH